MRALVTGGGGFLGARIVRQLIDAGWSVRTLARSAYPDLTTLGVETIRGDIQNRETVHLAAQGCEVVFHTAAIAALWGPKSAFEGINVTGTENVIAACLAAGVPRLVHTSSPSVTFDGSDQSGVDESVSIPETFLADYPRTKAIAERLILDADSTETAVSGVTLRTTALRPHLIWGEGDRHLIPRLLARARAGQLVQVGRGNNLVDQIHVDNAALAHRLAAEALAGDAPAGGRAYFLSQGTPVNLWDWIGQILDLGNVPRPKRTISFRTAYAVGWTMEMAWTTLRRTDEPRMTRFLAAQLATDHYYDLSAAQRDLGYQPVVSFEEGMARLGEAIRSGAMTP